MPQQAAGAMDPDRQDSCRVACGRKAGCAIGSATGTDSNGGIGRLAEMGMFPVFSVLFPVCSHFQRMNSLRSQCSRFSEMTLWTRYFQSLQNIHATRNTGNIGNRIENARFEYDQTRNKTWNSGNERRSARLKNRRHTSCSAASLTAIRQWRILCGVDRDIHIHEADHRTARG